jgi:predicted nucleic acid-binding protein
VSSLRFPAPARLTFVDSSAFFALATRRDVNHEAARTIQNRLIGERWRLFTTNFVVAETHALVLNRVNRALAFRMLQEIDRSATTTIVRVSPADEVRARTIIEQYQDKDFSLTDATSFAVMERLGLTTAFAFDRNFTQYRLTVLTP